MSASPPLSTARARLRHQLLGAARAETPAQAVGALLALQAQDYQSALWAIGLRTRAATLADVERAFAEREIVRSWPLRGTLQVVRGEDLAWMLALCAERRLAAGTRRREQLGLDAALLGRAETVLLKALRGGERATRGALLTLWERGGIVTAGERGYHLLHHFALRGLICFGPRRGAQDTFVLLDEWLPRPRTLRGEEALAELARRYFASRAPASAEDLAWWAGITLTQARAALANVEPAAAARAARAEVLLLPGFDEYLLGYVDRSAALDPAHARAIAPGHNGVFLPTLVVNGRVAGTWRARKTRREARIELAPFAPLDPRVRAGAARAAARYGQFLGLPATLA